MKLLLQQRKFITVFLVLVFFSLKEHAQVKDSLNTKPDSIEDRAKPRPPDQKPTDQKAVEQKDPPKVIAAYKSGDIENYKAGIGDIITVRVLNLNALLNKSACKTVDGKDSSTNCEPQEIRLFINNRLIKNIKAISVNPNADTTKGKFGEIQYCLTRDSENDPAWADLLGAPTLEGDGRFFTRPVAVSVGLEKNNYAIPTLVRSFNLVRMNKGWFWTCFIFLILYLYLIIRLARYHGLLRDRGINLSVLGISRSNGQLPYSLGRFQMAFWFTLVISSFLFIWLITDNYNIITGNILALIGISVGTSLSSAVIDNSKDEEILKQTVDLKAEQDQLDKEIINLKIMININPAPANIIALNTELSEKEARLLKIKPQILKNIDILKPKTSQGFFNDILSDVNGISFHRLQMFAWTLVLGTMFIFSVWVRLSMPEFSTTLLALQGLTAGTYLGFKIPEKQA